MGFLGIVAFSIGTLFVLEYWRDYQNEEELKTLIKGTSQKEYENYEPVSTSTLDVSD